MKKVSNNHVEKVMESGSHRSFDRLDNAPLDVLKYIFRELVEEPWDIDFDVLGKIMDHSEYPFFTGSRKIGGYTDKSDVDLVIAITEKNYDNLRARKINIYKNKLHLDKCVNEQYDNGVELSPVSTFRFGIVNIILVTKEDYRQWMFATSVACEMKLTRKKDRIILFHAIRNKIVVSPNKYMQYEQNDVIYSFNEEETVL